MSYYGGGWPCYQSVAELREQAQKRLEKLKKSRKNIAPVTIEGRVIARTFWGKQWCRTLETCSDYDNRLPRGRSYVRHGAVLDLQVTAGNVTALVAGSRVYKVNVSVQPLEISRWQSRQSMSCDGTGLVASLIALLQGRLPPVVLDVLTDPDSGLFPEMEQMRFTCDCPDWAELCKHVAAALYGVGARLDSQPELLFLLRQVDLEELIRQDNVFPAMETAIALDQPPSLVATDLSSLFGIEWDESSPPDLPSGLTAKASSWPLEDTPPPESAPKSKRAPRRKTAATGHAE